MFCSQCGLNLGDTARFCSRCGTPVASASPTAGAQSPLPQPASSVSPAYSPAATTSPSLGYTAPGGYAQGQTQSQLVSLQGAPLPALQSLASALFGALDRSVEPKNTNGLEVGKLMAYRRMSGLDVPPYYGEQVLPMYYNCTNCEIVPNQPVDAPVLTSNGWSTFLLHKITVEPEKTFYQLLSLTRALGLAVSLQRSDLPSAPNPAAQARENQFRQEIYALAARVGAMINANGGGKPSMFGGFGGAGGGGGNNAAAMRLQAAKMLAESMKVGGAMMSNAASSGSGLYTFTYN